MTGQRALLALSGERDQWERWVRATWHDGHRAGYAAGYDHGYAQAVTAWKVTAGTISGGPSFAEMDRRRYPPGGRQSWIIPRPGEDTGSQHG